MLLTWPAPYMTRGRYVRDYLKEIGFDKKTPIDLLGIEDVPYITEPFMPRIALLEEVVRHGD